MTVVQNVDNKKNFNGKKYFIIVDSVDEKYFYGDFSWCV